MPWIFVLLLSACFVSASSVSPAILNPATGNRYVLLSASTWQAAEAEAMALGGHLVTINDQAEEDWVYNTFVTYRGQTRLLWIGLTDAGHEGKWKWVNGDPGEFRAWTPGEPNGTYGEDFVAIYYPGHHAQNLWNDWPTLAADPIGLPMCGVVEIEPSLQQRQLIARGAVWRYLDNGSDQGTAWRTLDFNDSSWKLGRAEFGYGDGGEVTVINPGGASRFITTYFRHTFDFAEPDASFSKLSLRLLRDDGAIVYINGVQAFRSNMPETYNYQTRALAVTQGDNEISFHNVLLNASMLRAGKNVIAVELHQQSQSSSDVSFDFELNLLQNRGPSVSLISPTNGQVIAGNSLVEFRVADDAPGTVIQFYSDSTYVGVTNNSPFFLQDPQTGGTWLQAVATDSDGLRATSAPVHINIGSTLVGARSVWKFLDSGTYPGTTWTSLEFNDSAWREGNAQFGYGDGDEATLVSYGPDSANKYVTTYFRKHLLIAGDISPNRLLLRCLFDDGIIVWLNGQEVYRGNMPAGPVTHESFALSAFTGADETLFREVPLDAILNADGENLIAVEVHQAWASSSDLSFDLELIGYNESTVRLAGEIALEQLNLSWPAWAQDYVLEESTTLMEEDWRPFQGEIMDDSFNYRVSIDTSAGQKFFRLQKAH